MAVFAVIFFGTVFVQGNIDLASAKNDTLDFFRIGDGLAMFRVRNDPLELGIAREFFNVERQRW